MSLDQRPCLETIEATEEAKARSVVRFTSICDIHGARSSPAKNSERLGIWGDVGDGAYSELPGFALDRRESWRFRAQGREESFVDAGAVIPSRIERRARCAPTWFRALPMTRATCSATVSTA